MPRIIKELIDKIIEGLIKYCWTGGLNVSPIERIVQYRKEHAMSQVEMAERAGIAQGTLSLIEAGKSQPTLATLRRLAEVMRIPLSVLLGEDK